MATYTIKIGERHKPDASEILARLDGVKWPQMVHVTNLMPRSVVLPEVPGLKLSSVLNRDGSQADAVVRSAAQLVRMVSSVGQIAKLQGLGEAMRIGVDLPDAKPQPKAEPKPQPKAAAKAAPKAVAKAEDKGDNDGS